MTVRMRFCFILMIWYAVLRVQAQGTADSGHAAPYFGTYDMLHLPHLKDAALSKRVITIAVVGDAFSLNNSTCQKYFYKNPNEIPNNGKDDDGNGYIDDAFGWDAADNDMDVSIPAGKEEKMYYGTMTAGIIIKLLERVYEGSVYDRFRIIPVKVSSSENKKGGAYEAGYEGIAYAVKMHADIICCGWSGVPYQAKYKAIFDQAAKEGILIIGAGGNNYSERIDGPGAMPGVIAMAAVDTGFHKIKSSAYGPKIDLAAPGEWVWAPHPVSDKAFIYADGTEAATALATGCAAVLKATKPEADARLITRAMRNTTRLIDAANPVYQAKLGSGFIDLGAAYEYLMSADPGEKFFSPARYKGDISISQKTNASEWQISPAGAYKGFVFTLGMGSAKGPDARLKFYSGDTVYASVAVKDFPLKLNVPGGKVKVVYDGKKGKDAILLSYAAEAMDSATMYCSGTKVLDKDHGVITDGSVNANYTNRCECKWQINAPKGKRVKLTFDQMDTEANKDFVWIFDGHTTQQDVLIAKFSGQKQPPVVTSRGNEVLLWFLADDARTGDGWKMHYEFTDAAPGYEVPKKKP